LATSEGSVMIAMTLISDPQLAQINGLSLSASRTAAASPMPNCRRHAVPSALGWGLGLWRVALCAVHASPPGRLVPHGASSATGSVVGELLQRQGCAGDILGEGLAGVVVASVQNARHMKAVPGHNSGVRGKSGWAILTRIVEGETDPTALADQALRRLKSKKPALQRALEGRIIGHHRFLLRQHMRQISFLEQMIGEYEKRIEEIVRPFAGAIPLLDTIPAINQTTVVAILAEIGPDMRQFPDHRHLCSWAGICPGNNESAGKHKSGVARKGSKSLRAILVECAWAASRTKDTYVRAQFRRIASRRETKRALIALAHTMLTVAYHVLRDGILYQELGADFFDRLNHGRLRSSCVKRLKSLGYTVEIKEPQTAAEIHFRTSRSSCDAGHSLFAMYERQSRWAHEPSQQQTVASLVRMPSVDHGRHERARRVGDSVT